MAWERTFSEKGLGASLEPSRYAYGDARLLFDPVWDTWSFPGYCREVALRGLPAEEEGRIKGTAVITDRLPQPDSSGIDPAVTYAAYSLTGRIADVHFLDGDFSSDPWALLDVDVEADPRWHGNLHREYDTRSNSHHFPIDCTYYLDPYTLSLEIVSFYDTTSCNTTGFVFPTQTDAWRGAKAPTVSDKNVATRISIESIDEFGRPLRVRHDNDVAREDDDLCEVIAYAESVSRHRILDAVHTWRLHHCVKEPVVFAGVRYRYDDRPEGQVDLGLPTHLIVERYDTSADDEPPLDEFMAAAVSYSAYGDVTRIRRPRDDGVEQTWEMTYDPFRLTPITTTVTASDVQTVLHASTDVDPFSLRPLALHDENGTTWRSYHDGFGRGVLETVQPPDSEQELVLWTADYLGDDGGNPEGRRIRIQKFHSELSKADLEADPAAAGAEATSSIAHFDEFGRQRFREHALGADYDNAILVAEQVTYDGLGRTVFSADPFILTALDESRYGTSLHYRPDDTIRCTIRGRGLQSLNTVTADMEARYPTCYERDYAENQVRQRIFGPNELLPGSPQNGAYSETASTAIGGTCRPSFCR